MSFIFSIGAYGGFYIRKGRICLGWIAFTYLPEDFDVMIERLLQKAKHNEH